MILTTMKKTIKTVKCLHAAHLHHQIKSKVNVQNKVNGIILILQYFCLERLVSLKICSNMFFKFLIENVFKSLIVIVKNIGIKKFKPYIELVLD